MGVTCGCDAWGCGTAMNSAFQFVADACGKELEAYSACVDAHPQSWDRECTREKTVLSSCAERSPTIMHIKKHCSSQSSAYNECLMNNIQTPMACASHLEKFLQCATAAADNLCQIQNRE